MGTKGMIGIEFELPDGVEVTDFVRQFDMAMRNNALTSDIYGELNRRILDVKLLRHQQSDNEKVPC
jgi:hypothetical protein